MKNIFQKSAMALAVASLSVSAFAGTLTGNPEVVLANEVFGAGSEATLVAAPLVEYNVAGAGATINASNEATVKFTLNKSAVFGENLSLIDNWAASNATLSFEFVGGLVLNSANSFASGDLSVVVDQGGEVDDNTVTFKIVAASTLAAPVVLDQVNIGQYRTKNLTSALARGVANPSVSLGAEFRNVTTELTDTTASRVIFRSQNGVALAGTPTTYELGGDRSRINVASSEQKFTNVTGSGAAQDFDGSNDLLFVDLGDISVIRTDALRGATLVATPGDVVQKENGDEFDFNGDDNINITISSTTSLDAFAGLYLSKSTCTATVPAGPTLRAVPASGADSVVISLKGETTVDLEGGYNLCAVAKADTVIPEQTFTAQLNVTYFNPRYTESEDTKDYEAILRNGCSVTLFNLPTTSVGDDAYIRLTNVSEIDGAVRAFVWTEDGERIDAGSELVSQLDAHATVVLHTNEGQGNGVFLGDVLENYSALTSGRHRIVLQGAFPACEAMGLIRTPAGVLVNMTSTTYSGDASRLGEFTNGTSNTTN